MKKKFNQKLFWSLPTTTEQMACGNAYCAIGAAAKAMGISDSILEEEEEDGFPYAILPILMGMTIDEMEKVYYINDFGDPDFKPHIGDDRSPNPQKAKEFLFELIKDRVELVDE